VRVAGLTKKLLTKFCGLQATVNEGTILASKNIHKVLLGGSSHNLENTALEISKETFSYVIADPEVQNIMDDLDIPSERDRLFQVFDADDNGTVSIRELVQGLLKVRGEAQRSDVLASLLAVRAVYNLVCAIQTDVKATRDMLSPNVPLEIIEGE